MNKYLLAGLTCICLSGCDTDQEIYTHMCNNSYQDKIHKTVFIDHYAICEIKVSDKWIIKKIWDVNNDSQIENNSNNLWLMTMLMNTNNQVVMANTSRSSYRTQQNDEDEEESMPSNMQSEEEEESMPSMSSEEEPSMSVGGEEE